MINDYEIFFNPYPSNKWDFGVLKLKRTALQAALLNFFSPGSLFRQDKLRGEGLALGNQSGEIYA